MTGLLVPASGRRQPGTVALLPLLFSCLLLSASLVPALAASLPAVRGARGMVVTPEAEATWIGREVLRAGGNAVDASIAIAFALAVTHPVAGNLGGGGFLLYRTPGAEYYALDFRETAPRGLGPEMFLDEDGRPVPGRSLRTGLAVGTPGSVQGLAEAHRRWGTLPWSSLVLPAARLAEDGFEVPSWLAGAFERSGQRLLEDPEARSIFTRDGRFPGPGQRLAQRDLAATLRRIAVRGSCGFSEGAVARALERSVRRHGGVLDRQDIAGYRPVVRLALVGSYRGHRVVTFPPPSSGGVVLLQILGMLERHDPAQAGPGSSLATHLLVEASRRAYADRSHWLGDPDHVEVPVESLLDPSYLRERAAGIDPARATPSSAVRHGEPPWPEPEDTLHFSVADPHGGAVALTTTLNTSFGTGIVAKGTGILLNNEMDDFALAPGSPDAYGLLGGEANAVTAGKRPLSSMSPTIVESAEPGPRPLLVLGSPGGSTIITSVAQVLINVIDHGMPLQEAVDAPRVHHQWDPDVIRYERRALPEDVARALRARGHRLEESPDPLGSVNAVGIDPDGHWLGAADPRREGAATGF